MPSRNRIGIEVRHADRGVGLLPHHRLGVEGDPEPGGGQHVQVVRAVADGHGLLERDALGGGDAAQHGRLARAVDHLTDDPPGETSVDDLEVVGDGVVDAELAASRSVMAVNPPETIATV
jgi:hypothetical protein